MADDYYTHVRREITPLLPASLGSVLDVGCGSGATLRWLKESHPEIKTTGVEYNPAMREALTRNVDHAHIGAIADVMPELSTYDTIFCLDVLEHVPDSDAALAGLAAKLNPGGAFIISLPNIAHYSVSLPLLLRRRFPYAGAGILDRTHLRFFVEESIVAFVNGAGLRIDEGRLSGLQGPRTKLLNAASLGLLRRYFTKQYIFRAQNRPAAGRQIVIVLAARRMSGLEGWRRTEPSEGVQCPRIVSRREKSLFDLSQIMWRSLPPSRTQNRFLNFLTETETQNARWCADHDCKVRHIACHDCSRTYSGAHSNSRAGGDYDNKGAHPGVWGNIQSGSRNLPLICESLSGFVKYTRHPDPVCRMIVSPTGVARDRGVAADSQTRFRRSRLVKRAIGERLRLYAVAPPQNAAQSAAAHIPALQSAGEAREKARVKLRTQMIIKPPQERRFDQVRVG
ncbi:MAG: class I SAM-dependent methyltransferase [Rhizobiales bacterium]|nr:class I SAM-dependent methyltransferase [Hyphomicrobiales bacterium]